MTSADLVIFVSAHAQRLISERSEATGRMIAKSVVIPHGVADEFRTSETRLPRPKWMPDNKCLVYVSNLEPYKSQIEVIRAFAEMRRRRPSSEKLVLVGPLTSHRYTRAVKAAALSLGISDDVLLAGPVPHAELPAVYRSAEVGIFASECENCPNVLLEAMAAGRPLLVSDCAPMPEFAGDAVLYADSSRPEDMATSLIRLLDEPLLRSELGRRAAAQARLYDWAATSRRTWQAVTDLASEMCGAESR